MIIRECGTCKSCHYRDLNREYCFKAPAVGRMVELSRIRDGIGGQCEYYKYNPEPLIGELAREQEKDKCEVLSEKDTSSRDSRSSGTNSNTWFHTIWRKLFRRR